MITIEIRKQFITWPDDVAITMMRYYHQHGVPFTLHRKCAHTGWNTTESFALQHAGEAPKDRQVRFL